MERLTERDSYGDVYVKQHDYVTAADKLAEYEDLEEQGELQRVRHGKWIVQDETYTRFKCSACGSENHSHRWEYCHNCGAKMESE